MVQIDLVNCVQGHQSAELQCMLGRCRIVQEKQGGPQAMGSSRAMGHEMPVYQLEKAHGLLMRSELISESLESREVLH
jgi:hypothetical protein